jgi:hypothetical protein
MKKKCILISVLVTGFILLCAVNLNAQVQVTQGSTHTYSVTPLPGTATYNYNWSVSGGTASAFGTAATSNNIVWDGTAGTYTITVYPVNPATTCAGNNQTLSVEIVAMSIIWSTLTSTQCPHTDNQTGDFSVVAQYTGITGAWTYTYIIDAGAPQSITVPSGTNTSTVNITGFTNASNTATADHTIRITSITTPDNYTFNYDGSETAAASHLHTATVQPTPATSTIIQN